MAEAPKATRRSSSSVRSSTHGRGGAGNIGYTATEVDPTDLQTPTLKGEVYTTGRGGTGNMAKNTDAEEARRAQDVVAYASSLYSPSLFRTTSHFTHHPPQDQNFKKILREILV